MSRLHWNILLNSLLVLWPHGIKTICSNLKFILEPNVRGATGIHIEPAHWLFTPMTRPCGSGPPLRGKMAAHGRRRPLVPLCFCILSLFIIAHSQDPTEAAGRHAPGVENPHTASETRENQSEEPPVEENQWEATAVEDEVPLDATSEQHDTSAHETKVSSPTSVGNDGFQEELVIRPLHSGDIYASFQFRTLWHTDFRRSKGKLAVSLMQIKSEMLLI